MNEIEKQRRVNSIRHARKSRGRPWPQGYIDLGAALKRASEIVAQRKAGGDPVVPVPAQAIKHLEPLRKRVGAVAGDGGGSVVVRIDHVIQCFEAESVRSLDKPAYRTNLKTTLKWVLGLVPVTLIRTDIVEAWSSRLREPVGAPKGLEMRKQALATAKSAYRRFIEWVSYQGVSPSNLVLDYRLSEFRRYLREVQGLGQDRVRDLAQFACALLRDAGFAIPEPLDAVPLSPQLERFVVDVRKYATGYDGAKDLVDEEDFDKPLKVRKSANSPSTFDKHLASFKAFYRYLHAKHGPVVETWESSEILKFSNVTDYLKDASRERVHGGIFTYLQMPKDFWEWGTQCRAAGFEQIEQCRAGEMRSLIDERVTPRVLKKFRKKDTRLMSGNLRAADFIYPAYAKAFQKEVDTVHKLLQGGAASRLRVAEILEEFILFSVYLFFSPNHGDALLLEVDPDYSPSEHGSRGQPNVWKSESPRGNYFIRLNRSKSGSLVFFQLPFFLTPLLDVYLGWCRGLLIPEGRNLFARGAGAADPKAFRRRGGRFMETMTSRKLGRKITCQTLRKEIGSIIYNLGFDREVSMILGQTKLEETGTTQHRRMTSVARRHYITEENESVEQKAVAYYAALCKEVPSLSKLRSLAEGLLDLVKEQTGDPRPVRRAG